VSQPLRMYIGTYTRPDYKGKAEGIYVYRMDPDTGALAPVQTVPDVENPSFLALDHQQRYLYAVNETKNGGVSAFRIDPATGTLTFLNRQPSRGDDPCHLCVDPTGRYVAVANYTSGSIAVLPIETDGSLGEAVDFVQHHGSGPNVRQAGAHMHMVVFSPDGQYLLTADLGIDRVLTYRLDTASGKLSLNDETEVPHTAPSTNWRRSAQLAGGAGPRHLAFHPNGRYVFVINELNSTIASFGYDAAQGALMPLGTVSTLPAGFSGESTTAEIVVAPSGAFVYGSNRGDDSIAVFAVDAATGGLTPVARESTRGKTPRSITLDPTGAFLYAANQNSDTIVTFRVQPDTGTLTMQEPITSVPTPICLLFATR